ncbi:hypothetical protein F5B21DRAFT_523978 [Xylaria acuta]|nr:hypothetical protein F5B21DRAFT_523978 [Xylaria acuta]
MSDGTAVGWQADPNRRGTLTIIENCLFTIFACTWSIQHPNVPKLDEAPWQTLLRQCKWTVFTLFFLEFLVAHAILEFVMAVRNMRSLDKEGLLDKNLPWIFRYFRQPLTGSEDAEAGVAKSIPVPVDAGQQEVKWALTHCYFANMGASTYVMMPGHLPRPITTYRPPVISSNTGSVSGYPLSLKAT